MQGKKTLVFITSGQSVAAELIKNEINKKDGVVCITVPCEKLGTSFDASLGKTKQALARYVKKPIMNVLHKISPKVKEVGEPIMYNGFNSKKAQNMLFRYSPSVIMVSDPDVMRSVKAITAQWESKIGLYVYSDSLGFDSSLIDNDVKHYFVDNINLRSELIAKGIFAEKITMSPLPVETKFFTEKEQNASKRNLGFDDDDRITVLNVNTKNYKELIEFAIGNTYMSEYVILTDEPNIKKLAEEKKIMCYERKSGEEEIYNAADIVVSAFDSYTVKRVAARGKNTIVYGNSENDEMVKVLAADNRIGKATDNRELAIVLSDFFENKTEFKPDETDTNSPKKIADAIEALLNDNTDDQKIQ